MDTLDELLSRGVAEVLVESELRAKLKTDKKLRLKQGFDPTKPDMHIGHAVGLRKLRKFQELGHQVVLIVGDWTAQIGDPSGPRRNAAPVDRRCGQGQRADLYGTVFQGGRPQPNRGALAIRMVRRFQARRCAELGRALHNGSNAGPRDFP